MPIGFNLKTKLIITMMLIVFSSTVIFSLYVYNSSKEHLFNDIDHRLFTASISTKCLLGDDFHDNIVDSKSISEERYMRNLHKLSQLAERLNIYYLYSFIEVDGKVLFTSSSATEEEIAMGNLDLFFDEYSEPSDELKALFKIPNGKELLPMYENYSDSYGEFRSILYPYRDSSGRVYLIGADLKISYIESYLQTIVEKTAFIGLIVLVISIAIFMLFIREILENISKFHNGLLGFFEYINRDRDSVYLIEIDTTDEFGVMAELVNRQISRIQKGLEQDKKLIKNANRLIKQIEFGQLNGELTIDGNNPELQELRDSINNMIRTLRLRIGLDINKIIKTMNSYGVMRFDVKIEGELGDIALNVNRMGEAIFKALNELEIAREDNRKKSIFLEELSGKLSKYLSPQIYDTIFEGKQQAIIDTKRKRLTVFFSDIKGFTSTTEFLESEDLTAMLNYYLNEMSEIALNYGATIDKFIGDAIMIFFGDPHSEGSQNDALKCVSMAIDMQKKMVDIREELFNRGIVKPLEIRIGIATGYVTVGNFGSDNRMDYTIVGSTVNLASRLESASEENTILIAESTYMLIKESIQCEKKGEIVAKGFSNPVPTYRVIDHKESIESRSFESTLSGFNLNIDLDQIEDSEKAIRQLNTVISELQQLK